MFLFSANCFVLAIDAPLPYGDKTELTKKLVSRNHPNINEKMMCAGKNGAVLFDNFHRGGFPQNLGNGTDPPQRKLSEKYVEHHGLCCSCHRVSEVFSQTSVLTFRLFHLI